MTVNFDKLRASLHLHEGVRSKPYKDTAGHLTIGIGHNLDADGLPTQIIESLLDYDIAVATAGVVRALPWVVKLDDVRQRVFIELWFNMGAKLMEFRTALFFAEEGKWAPSAAAFRHSLWAKQVGQRAVTLTRMLETGQDPA